MQVHNQDKYLLTDGDLQKEPEPLRTETAANRIEHIAIGNAEP